MLNQEKPNHEESTRKSTLPESDIAGSTAAGADRSENIPQSTGQVVGRGKQRSSANPPVATGPRTIAGKNVSKYNATKHGLFSDGVLKSESRTTYEELLKGLREDFRPEGALENFLVEKLSIQGWRYRRFVRAERLEIEKGPNSLELVSAPNSSVLNRFPRYETTIERSFDRTLLQLERVQRMRLGLPVLPPVKIDITS
jgi:hypothetical protein